MKKKDILLVVELDSFAISTITLPKLEILATMVANAKIITNIKINIDTKISTEEQVFDFPHALGNFLVDTTPTEIKVEDMKIAKWNLSKKVQICPLNLGIRDDPNW
jgi:hypothetical protein